MTADLRVAPCLDGLPCGVVAPVKTARGRSLKLRVAAGPANNVNSSLVVTPGGFDTRVVRVHHQSWDEIERIDVRQARAR